MNKRNHRQYDDDDGRTICDMNVPGMPWYERDQKRARRDERRAQRRSVQTSAPQYVHDEGGQPLSLRERMRNAFSVALAGLTVFVVIGGAMLLFMWFCMHVWLA